MERPCSLPEPGPSPLAAGKAVARPNFLPEVEPGQETSLQQAPPQSGDRIDGADDESAGQEERPNFSGRYLLQRIEGDSEQLLVDAGVGWAKRKLAKSMNYGVGKATQEISQVGDDLTIRTQAGPVKSTMVFRVGAGAQRTQAATGEPATVLPQWDGDCLVVTLLDKKTLPIRRRLEGGFLVTEQGLSTGGLVRRVFVPQGAAAAGSSAKAALGAGLGPPAAGAAASGGCPPNSAAEGATAGHPSFAGKWLLDRVDGDLEPVLVEAGMPWAFRKIARKMNYGAGRQTQDITQDGDALTVVTSGGPKVHSMRFVIGADELEVEGPGGGTVLVKAWWDDECLVMAMNKPGRRPAPPPSRRFLCGEEMVIEATTTAGHVAKRIFRREGAAPASARVARPSSSAGDATPGNPQDAATPLLSSRERLEPAVATGGRAAASTEAGTGGPRRRWCQCFRHR